jgi:hypothetical protein
MKINHRTSKRNKSAQPLGFLPSTIDRSFFQTRLDKINALSPAAMAMVLEFENNFRVTTGTGPSYANLLDGLVNNFETQFKTTKITNKGSPYLNAMASALNFYWFTLPAASGNQLLGTQLSFMGSYLQVIANSDYVINNYSSPFIPFSYPMVNQFDNPDYNNKLVIQLNTNQVRRTIYVGNPQIAFDFAGALKISCANSFWNASTSLYDYHSITPTEFFTTMRDAIAVIRWLETENNDIAIVGNIDGVKVAAYETTLNTQLTYINTLSDIVANANIKLVTDGQALKDATNALIVAKQAEIESLKTDKRKNIAAMLSLSNNTDSIIAAQKLIITKTLTGA